MKIGKNGLLMDEKHSLVIGYQVLLTLLTINIVLIPLTLYRDSFIMWVMAISIILGVFGLKWAEKSLKWFVGGKVKHNWLRWFHEGLLVFYVLLTFFLVNDNVRYMVYSLTVQMELGHPAIVEACSWSEEVTVCYVQGEDEIWVVGLRDEGNEVVRLVDKE